ncbi:hypothetical protein [Flavobacterium branchiophilum]|uniref:hypothetical protein n=1 Tax=Flavobacterium branchiophilum TaxID=55197 RepID=UPI0011BEEB20|nr:hypothetical protein [Flavobacterium branchiophilum]
MSGDCPLGVARMRDRTRHHVLVIARRQKKEAPPERLAGGGFLFFGGMPLCGWFFFDKMS